MNLLVIKISNNSTSLIENIENSCSNKSDYYYNTTGNTELLCKELFENQPVRGGINHTIIIIHNFNKPYKAYLCKSEYLKSNSNIHCKNLKSVENNIDSISTFMNDIQLDLDNNFNNNTYITIKEISDNIYFNFFNKVYHVYEPIPKSIDNQNQEYKRLKENVSTLDTSIPDLSQKDSYCIRPLGIQRLDFKRSEFQRDRERIIHTKAFRRLVDKAQIFTSNKGDHYRTRMTHTLEVSQMSRGISQELNLNLDLTESIALGHDIGHTPFGHQGERTLRDILHGKVDIIPNASELEIGGFNHNYQALRVLTYLEEKYIEHEGVDLSYQTLEGILKHTKCKIDDIKSFLINGESKYLYLDNIDEGDNKNSFSVTLEGQVVEIADEIAQRGHDLDDAFAAGLLNINSFKDACTMDFMKKIKEIIEDIENKIDIYKNKNRILIDETDMVRAILVPKILSFLISDVVTTSIDSMRNYNIDFFEEHKRVDKKLISFSKDGKLIIEHLENLIFKNVINTFEVSRFDSKASFIISSLFKTYYTNPKLLPDSVLLRFKKELSKASVNSIDIRFDDPKTIAEELKEITTITTKQSTENDYAEIYKTKRKILARCITDHISGMTDNYALNEYSKLHESISGHI